MQADTGSRTSSRIASVPSPRATTAAAARHAGAVRSTRGSHRHGHRRSLSSTSSAGPGATAVRQESGSRLVRGAVPADCRPALPPAERHRPPRSGRWRPLHVLRSRTRQPLVPLRRHGRAHAPGEGGERSRPGGVHVDLPEELSAWPHGSTAVGPTCDEAQLLLTAAAFDGAAARQSDPNAFSANWGCFLAGSP